ncbi:hypothetical protein L1049_004449 [Liquidambar formosana]|uniref:adenylate dimethylallyltransferase (ADP/ATP-dependent) n=1 Tax=Liquidambar formosana TaxID=63359 RepID=A0AAP0WYA4_LIQFO
MGISTLMCKQTQPVPNILSGARLNMDIFNTHRHKDKVVVVMGATGTGKSRLSIDLATRFPAEIVNSDKMQVYKGLDIVTNKITKEEQRGVPHHLLGILNPDEDFTATDFCDMASLAVGCVVSRGHLPIIVGGSNSYMEALINDEAAGANYECCFLCVDVSLPVLHSFVSERVDRMIENGMVGEVRTMFDTNNVDYSGGIRRAIGVPELDKYFRQEEYLEEGTRCRLLQEAICEIKGNTCKLASRQSEKINGLQNRKGWKLHRLDATDVFLKRGREADEAWEKLVVGPSSVIVGNFLYNVAAKAAHNVAAAAIRPAAAMGSALAAAIH